VPWSGAATWTTKPAARSEAQLIEAARQGDSGAMSELFNSTRSAAQLGLTLDLRRVAALALRLAAAYFSSVNLSMTRLAVVGAVLLLLLLLRGCPMCWLMGFFETIQLRRAQNNSDTLQRTQ
jgi:hypothetical protein